MISTLSFSAWVAIGRLVGDHLWQSTLFAALAGLLTLGFRNNRAQVRNALWLAASVKFLIPFAALVAIGNHFGWRRAAPLAQTQSRFTINMDTVSQPFTSLTAGSPPAVASHSLATAAPIFLFAIWLCGCALILITWWRGWRRVSVIVRQASPVQHGPELDALRRLEGVAGIRKPVVLVSSNTSLEPGVFGIRSPVLLWPRSLAGRLTGVHVEMILAHELSHVRRRDNLAAAVHMVVETLFWFHPLVWWLGARMVDERERACDEDVLRLGGEPQVYAESVLKVCEFYLESPLACVAGVTGSNLKKRMERIMSNRVGETLTGRRKLFLVTTGVVALAVPLVAGVLTAPHVRAQGATDQSAPGAAVQPKFEVTSVKSDKSGNAKIWMANLVAPGGHFTATNFTLRGLIGLAYNLSAGQARKTLLGTPDWVDSERFDIEAETDSNPTIPQKQLLLQSLLADRFGLTMHHETRQLPIYALVLSKAGKTGPQLKPHSDDAKCLDPSGPTPPHPGAGEAMPAFCGGFFLSGQDGRLREAGNKVTMGMLAGALSDSVDRTVVDKTGLAGFFDVSYEAAFAMRDGQIDATIAADPSGPLSIFTAVQEQLGLKLEAQTGSADVLVIDHVEQPSEN